MVSDPAKQAQQAVAIADAEIQNMEAQLSVVRKQLAGLSGTDAEQIAVSLKTLSEKVEAARERRASIAKRAARVQRMAEITLALREVRAAIEPLLEAGDRGPRFEELRQRAVALQEEAAKLKGGAA
jgi:hypothetical protein